MVILWGSLESYKETERQNYLKNAYRVLLTRARQGMVIVVPSGDLKTLLVNQNFITGIELLIRNRVSTFIGIWRFRFSLI